MTVKVFIVDDHDMVRTGLRMILSGHRDIEIVGEADTGEAALPTIRQIRPDIVLCDLQLPGISGLEVTERIVMGDYGPRVIIVSVLEDGPMPRRLLNAGAWGYIGKRGEASELVAAVREVAAGRRFLGTAVAHHMALASISGLASPLDELSPRELEVSMLLVQGHPQHEIARRLALSPKTVNTHKSRLFGKLGVRDPVGLARLLRQYGLLCEGAPA